MAINGIIKNKSADTCNQLGRPIVKQYKLNAVNRKHLLQTPSTSNNWRPSYTTNFIYYFLKNTISDNNLHIFIKLSSCVEIRKIRSIPRQIFNHQLQIQERQIQDLMSTTHINNYECQHRSIRYYIFLRFIQPSLLLFQ